MGRGAELGAVLDMGAEWTGGFGAAGGQARVHRRHPRANSTVRALAVSGSTVYAGGQFSSIGGRARNLIAALRVMTGRATAWNPNATGFAGYSGVYALAVTGSTVYAGGNFSSIGGVVRNNIAALDARTGETTAWNPSAGWDVVALAVSRSTIYAGGNFSSIGGVVRDNIAALDVS